MANLQREPPTEYVFKNHDLRSYQSQEHKHDCTILAIRKRIDRQDFERKSRFDRNLNILIRVLRDVAITGTGCYDLQTLGIGDSSNTGFWSYWYPTQVLDGHEIHARIPWNWYDNLSYYSTRHGLRVRWLHHLYTSLRAASEETQRTSHYSDWWMPPVALRWSPMFTRGIQSQPTWVALSFHPKSGPEVPQSSVISPKLQCDALDALSLDAL